VKKQAGVKRSSVRWGEPGVWLEGGERASSTSGRQKKQEGDSEGRTTGEYVEGTITQLVWEGRDWIVRLGLMIKKKKNVKGAENDEDKNTGRS